LEGLLVLASSVLGAIQLSQGVSPVEMYDVRIIQGSSLIQEIESFSGLIPAQCDDCKINVRLRKRRRQCDCSLQHRLRAGDIVSRKINAGKVYIRRSQLRIYRERVPVLGDSRIGRPGRLISQSQIEVRSCGLRGFLFCILPESKTIGPDLVP